jgi:hypothetical protein
VLEAIADDGGYHALPGSDSLFEGKTPDPDIGGYPPPPYPGNQEFTVTVQNRILTPQTQAVQVTVSWGEGAIKLEKVFNAVE